MNSLMFSRLVRSLGLCTALSGALTARAHVHLAAGAVTPELGSTLKFVNAANFGSESSYVFQLELAGPGPYAGYYYGELTLVCLAATLDYGGPVPLHPALGARVAAEVLGVTGPTGGEFGFWESPGDEEPATELTFGVPVGRTPSVPLIPVSENDGSPGTDPYGHIHGRVVSFNSPGFYQVRFRFVDTSTSAPGGTPWHPPSAEFQLQFQAGVSIAGITSNDNGVELSFATALGFTYVVEGSASLDGPWSAMGDAVAGNDHLQRQTVEAGSPFRFFRLRREGG